MGAKKMMSPKSRFVGANLRAPATAKTQGREDDKVHWTPVFARGRCTYMYAMLMLHDVTLGSRHT
jgi:hypothetical protein